MGYETDTYGLAPAGQVFPSGSLFTPSGAFASFGGADFVRGVIRVAVSAISGATAFAWGLQVGDGSGNWFPTVTTAGAVAALQAGATVTPAAATNFASYFSVFPGTVFRLVAFATAGTVTATITGDFQKWVADST